MNDFLTEDDTILFDKFIVRKTRYGTYQSYDLEGNGLILTNWEDVCINATLHLLYWREHGYTPPDEVVVTYDSFVGGKL